jgi:hypothetical protein
VADGLCTIWDYTKLGQEGGPLLLSTELPSHQRIAILLHKSLKIGTLNKILRIVAALKNTTREEILSAMF